MCFHFTWKLWNNPQAIHIIKFEKFFQSKLECCSRNELNPFCPFFISILLRAQLPNMQLLLFFDVTGSKKMILGEMINFAKKVACIQFTFYGAFIQFTLTLYGPGLDWLQYDMIWYDMIWYDMIRYDMIWYDMIR